MRCPRCHADLKELLTYEEAAELLRVSRRSIINLIDQGDLERIYILGNEPRVTRSSLQRYIERKQQENSSLHHAP